MLKNKNTPDSEQILAKTAKKHHLTLYDKYTIFIGIAGQSMHYIQAYKIFSTKSSADISLLAYFICLFLLVNWLIYGLVKKAKALVYAETIGIFGVILIISGTLLYS